MKLNTQTINKSLSPSYRLLKPKRNEMEHFKRSIQCYLNVINSNESEENLKTHLMDFFKKLYGKEHLIEQQERIDFVIRTGGKGTNAAILFESKKLSNKQDMISHDNINKKALHELVLYFMRERYANNTDIKFLVICNEFAFYVFEANEFERSFYKNTNFKNDFVAWTEGKKTDSTTDFFYNSIVKPFIAQSGIDLTATYFDLNDFRRIIFNNDLTEDNKLIPLFKVLSPEHLLKKPFANDSNSLNQLFYDELLHVIGLFEEKDSSKLLIKRLEEKKRNPASLLENTISKLKREDEFMDHSLFALYGTENEERSFNMALELCITWINRLLFLKLLESQIVNYQRGNKDYRFLNGDFIQDYDELADLFFGVLALKPFEREEHIKDKYDKVPYLNSSLFEKTELEKVIGINQLNNSFDLPLYKATVLRDDKNNPRYESLKALDYIFQFLDAYDFSSEGGEEIQEESKTIINAAVLGLIFEKINGYKDGSIFTPGYITMYMSGKVIEKTLLEKFKAECPNWSIESIDDLKNYLSDYRSTKDTLRFNALINSIKICDPAVGSGHFLVSCLNELIAIKSRLGLLADSDGNRLSEYDVHVDNDEIIITNCHNSEIFSYQMSGDSISKRLQHVQKTLFNEKQTLIENCLFGVDINPNSVKICRLRLWIELLKNAYYKEESGFKELETLPNIDINIKCGNSLLSRYNLDQNLSDAFNKAELTVADYKQLVQDYKITKNRQIKRELTRKIDSIKSRFKNEALAKLEATINQKISELQKLESQPDLFVLEGQAKKSEKAKLTYYQEEITKLKAQKESYQTNNTFFNAMEWRFEFPEVLDDNGNYIGFDIVIANPPYGVPIKGSERKIITDSLGKVPDYEIYYLFLNLARRLIKQSGHNSQIIPNTILFNVNAQNFRKNILDSWGGIEIDDLTQYKIFSKAVVHNIIISTQKKFAEREISYKKTGETLNINNFLAQNYITVEEEMLLEYIKNWGLIFKLDQKILDLVSKIRNNNKVIKNIFPEISQGLIAYDKYQGQNDYTIKNRIFHTTEPSNNVKPWLNGADISPYNVKWNGIEYINYCDKLANPRNPKFFTKERILVREITNPKIYAGYTSDELYNDPAIINILDSKSLEFPIFCLLGILNSQLATFYHFNSSPKAMKGAFPKILVDDIKNFPLPMNVSKEKQDKLTNLVTQMMQLKKVETNHSKIQALESKIDELVFQLYDLSESDRTSIQNSLASTKSLSSI